MSVNWTGFTKRTIPTVNVLSKCYFLNNNISKTNSLVKYPEYDIAFKVACSDPQPHPLTLLFFKHGDFDTKS